MGQWALGPLLERGKPWQGNCLLAREEYEGTVHGYAGGWKIESEDSR